MDQHEQRSFAALARICVPEPCISTFRAFKWILGSRGGAIDRMLSVLGQRPAMRGNFGCGGSRRPGENAQATPSAILMSIGIVAYAKPAGRRVEEEYQGWPKLGHSGQNGPITDRPESARVGNSNNPTIAYMYNFYCLGRQASLERPPATRARGGPIRGLLVLRLRTDICSCSCRERANGWAIPGVTTPSTDPPGACPGVPTNCQRGPS